MSKHILFSLVFSSCLVFVSCGSDKPGTETPTTPIVPKATFEDVLKATKSEYKEDPAFQVCMADSSTRCVNSVIQNRAMKDHQEDLCSDIVNTDYRDSCLFWVISEKARETKDLSLCDKLKNQQKMYCKQTLVTQLALANKNPDECTKIISASASGEQSLVASERSAVDNCRLSVTLNMATKREDGVWCGKIENVMMKTSCTQSIESRFPAPITPVSTGSTTPTRRSR